MTENLTEEEEYFDPIGNGQPPPRTDENTSYSYGALFDAPDFASLIKGRRSPHAREYETKVKSALKSGAIGCMRTGNITDAAAIFRHGPGFAAATGDLCAVNDQAKKAVDLLTAPENPYFAFVFAALPFIAQLYRNHETQFEAIPAARKRARQQKRERKLAEDKRKIATLHVPFMRREIKIRIGLRATPFKSLSAGFKASSRPPQELVTIVFSDAKLREALAKQGIEIVQIKDNM